MNNDELKAKLDVLIRSSRERTAKTKRKLIHELMTTGMITVSDVEADHFDELWKEFRESAQDLAALEAARAFIND